MLLAAPLLSACSLLLRLSLRADDDVAPPRRREAARDGQLDSRGQRAGRPPQRRRGSSGRHVAVAVPAEQSAVGSERLPAIDVCHSVLQSKLLREKEGGCLLLVAAMQRQGADRL